MTCGMRVQLGLRGELRKISVQYEFIELKKILRGSCVPIVRTFPLRVREAMFRDCRNSGSETYCTSLECARIIIRSILPKPGESKVYKIKRMRAKPLPKSLKPLRPVPSAMPFLERFHYWELLIFVAALAGDWNSWGHQFVMDDLSRIVGNPLIRGFGHLHEIFLSPYNLMYGMPSGLYRPLTTLTFALNYGISGLNPDGFHAVNRMLHVLTSLGIFWILRRLISGSPVAIVTALLFAVHPVQTEAVTYINGRSDSLVMFLFVFSWLFFIRARTSGRVLPYACSVTFYLLALFSKESAITWLGVALLTEFVFFSQSQLRTFWLHLREHFIKFYAGYLLVSAAYLALRFSALKGVSKLEVTLLDNPLAYVTGMVRVLTGLKILFQSLGMLLWPMHLSADYSYNQIPMILQVSSPAALGILALTTGFCILLVWSYRRAPAVFFGLGYFLITYSLISNLLIPIGTIRADRLLYMPSLGIFLLAGIAFAGINASMERFSAKKVARVILALALLLMLARTVSRNQVWRDEFTLYAQTVQDAPRSAKAHNNLGAQYFSRGEFGPALEQFTTAETIKPDYPDLLNNMGSLFSRERKSVEAIAHLNRAVSLSPTNPEIRNNYGLALKAQGRLADAIAQYDIVIQQYPSNADAHFNKANALVAQNKTAEAISEFSRTLEIDPRYMLARSNLTLLLQRTNPVPQQP